MTPIYRPLDGGQIRLLDLFPGHFNDSLIVRLRPISLRNADTLAYEALSYVWGTGTPTTLVHMRDHNDLQLPITGNLESALRHLRQPDRLRTLWVDALCINQLDIPERGSQVLLMADIYTAASQVLIWLGPEEYNDGVRYSWSDLERTFQHEITVLDDPELRATYVTNVGRTIYHVLTRSWFERTWVVQEAALPKADPSLIIGHNVFSWTQFEHNAVWLTEWVKDVPSINATHYRSLQAHVRNLGSIRRAFQEPSKRETGPFAYQLQRTIRSVATDPRDKIFGILAISAFDSERILPDYTKSLKEVYAEATIYMLNDRYLSIYFETPLRPLLPCKGHDSTTSSGWPSWVPNFTYASRRMLPSYTTEKSFTEDDPLLSIPFEGFPMMLDTSFVLRFECLSKCLPSGLPAARISSDNAVLHTVGLHAGIIVHTSGKSLQTLEWTEPPWMSVNAVYNFYHEILAPRQISPSDYLRVLVTESHRADWVNLRGDQDAENQAFEHFLNASRHDRQAYDAFFEGREYKEEGRAPRWVCPMRKLAKVFSFRSKGRILFVTDTNLVGMSYHEDATIGIKSGDVLVGLFGINFPFILRCNCDDATTYGIINLASVSNHQWGHDFLGNTFNKWGVPPEAREFESSVSWKDFEKYGLREYTIV